MCDVKKKKIKVTEAFVIVGDMGEPTEYECRGRYYFSIKYKMIGEENYTVGFSSYCLDYVFKWLDENFEIVEEHEEDESKNKNIDWWYKSVDDDIKNMKEAINEVIKYFEKEKDEIYNTIESYTGISCTPTILGRIERHLKLNRKLEELNIDK